MDSHTILFKHSYLISYSHANDNYKLHDKAICLIWDDDELIIKNDWISIFKRQGKYMDIQRRINQLFGHGRIIANNVLAYKLFMENNIYLRYEDGLAALSEVESALGTKRLSINLYQLFTFNFMILAIQHQRLSSVPYDVKEMTLQCIQNIILDIYEDLLACNYIQRI